MTTPTATPRDDLKSPRREPYAVFLTWDAVRTARIVVIACLVAEIAFFILDYHVNYGRASGVGALRRMFNTAREDGLASWFASTQTLLMGLTLWLIYAITKAASSSKARITGWLVLASFFTYMAVDDGAQLHERLATALESGSDGGVFDAFPSYAWHIIFLPVFAALGLFTLVFLWVELRTTLARAVLVGAMALLALAVGLDFIEGLEPDHRWNAYTWLSGHTDIEAWSMARFGRSGFDTLRHFSKSIEETTEMAANSLLWFLFLSHLPRVSDELRVRFRTPRTAAEAESST